MEPITTRVTTPIVLGGSAYPSPLDIDATGSVEPSGNVGANAISSKYTGVSLVNNGIVIGGAGALDGSVAGGIGVDITGSASISTYYKITGGKAYAGGAGGTAVALHGGSLLAKGSYGIYGGASSGAGGTGGAGVALFGSTTTAMNYGKLYGGAGSSGATGGVGVIMAAGTLTNHGSLIGGVGNAGAGGIGVDVTGTGTVSNFNDIFGGNASGGATGGIAVDVTGSATVSNSDDINGGHTGGGGIGGDGVVLHGGTLNAKGGFGISGGFSSGSGGVGGVGLAMYGATTTATIDGKLYGGGGTVGASGGLALDLAGGTVTNNGDGQIQGGSVTQGGAGNGGNGATVASGTTLTNGGNINGGNSFANGATGNGGTGVIVNGGTLYNILATSSGNSYGRIVGGSAFQNGGVGVQLNSGPSIALVNQGTIGGGQSTGARSGGSGGVGLVVAAGLLVDNDYVIRGGGSTSGNGGAGVTLATGSKLYNDFEVFGGSATGSGNGGVGVSVEGGKLTNNRFIFGGSTSSGTYGAGVYLNGGEVENYGTIQGTGTGDSVKFGTATGTLILHGATGLNGDIGTFAKGDVIDLTTIARIGASYIFDSTTDVLTVTNGANSVTLNFDSSVSGDSFILLPDTGVGTGAGTDVMIACYRRGTQIRCERGEVAIEALKIGDRVVTLSGIVQPIRWIGHRRYSREIASGNPEVLPIKIMRNALGDDLPLRDLWVSPEHALFIDGILIPAAALVNELTILQDESVAGVEYFHLEFDSHAVIYAEGAPAESFVDDDSRRMFDNAAEYSQPYPYAARDPLRFCAPRIEEGELLESVRRRLAKVTGRALRRDFSYGSAGMVGASSSVAHS